MENKLNYEAFVSCYNDAFAALEFYADSAALANEYITKLLEDDNMKVTLEWDKFPGQIHYIRYKKKGNINSKYLYTKKEFTKQAAQPSFSEIYKRWNEYDKLKEDNEILKTNISIEYDKGLNHGLQLSYERDQEIITKLKEDKALLIEALGNLVTIDCQLYKNAHLMTEIRTAKDLLNNLKK